MKSLQRQIADGCRYFNGVSNKRCRFGVAYADTCRLPQTCRSDPTACALWEPWTAAEVDDRVSEINSAVDRHFSALEDGTCLTCGKSTEPREQVGRCVYGACGCRLYQGRISHGAETHR